MANAIEFESGGTNYTVKDAVAQNVLKCAITDAGQNGTESSGVYNINTHQIETPLTSTRHFDIDVTGKHVAYVVGYIYHSVYPLWILLDANNDVVSYSDTTVTSTTANAFVIIPQNAVRLIVNCSVYESRSAYILPNIAGMVNASEEKITSGLQDASETAAFSIGNIENGVWNVTSHQYVTPLASTRHIEVPVQENEVWYIAGYYYNASFPLWVLFDSNGSEIKTSAWNTAGAGNEIVSIPATAVKMVVNCSTNTPTNYARKVIGYAANNYVNTWRNKNIVWLGTSIPAGAKYGLNNFSSYPMIIGAKLGATVYNESVGESSVHCKLVQRINATYNPYGFVENWEKCARCLTNTIAEVEWLCANYDIKDAGGNYIFTTNRPTSLSDADITFYKSCSYQNKIASRLSGNNIDLWVFDHGHNDNQYNDNVVNGQTKTDDEMEELYGKNNLYTWQGACNFIFTYILEANNKAKIVMIGEYDNRLADVPPAQMKVAESWEFPIYKQWEVIGWNVNHKIRTTGYWNNSTGLWVESGGAEQEITIHDRFVRDHIHPSSDASGYATNHIAKLMAKWFVNNSVVE